MVLLYRNNKIITKGLTQENLLWHAADIAQRRAALDFMVWRGSTQWYLGHSWTAAGAGDSSPRGGWQ